MVGTHVISPVTWLFAVVRGCARRQLWLFATFAMVSIGPLVPVGQSTSGQAFAAPAADIPDDWFFDGANRPKPLRALEGQPAPELALKEWIGEETTIKSQRGKVVVVDFWATWCGPCMASIPKNIDLVKNAKEKGLVFIGVHDNNAGWDKAAGVVNDKGINYSVARDTGESVKRFALQFWPTYVVIDRAGVVRAAGLLPDKVHDVVDMLLAEAPPADLGVAESGNPATWYFGGAKRPTWLKAIEGKPMAQLPVGAEHRWYEVTPAANRASLPERWKGRILIAHCFSPTNDIAIKQLTELQALVEAFEPQGVSFVGICDARADWTGATKLFADRKITFPILHDAAGPPESPMGAWAGAVGLKLGPATLVVDRRGVIRAAGVRPDRLKEALTTLLAEPIASEASPD